MSTRQSGQALVVMVGVMFLSIAILAVIIDGGNVLTQQRVVQAGSDSTAEAGAVVLATRLAGVPEPLAGWDATIAAKVAQSAAANNMTVKAAYYTDICGIPLRADGTAALKVDGSEDLAVAMGVGGGSLPGGTATTPDCPALTVGPVAGVMVIGEKNVGTFVARAIGVPSVGVNTRATAVAGYLQGYCPADQGEWCAVLPVTIPVNQVTCDGQNNVVPGSTAWPWNTVLTVPLCKNSPGNVGWLDWTPPGGGAKELVCSIVNPDNPLITLPSWQWVPATGNTNGGGKCADDDTGISYTGVEEAIRKYNGQIVLIPQFDLTCLVKNGDPNPVSTKPTIETPPYYGCPNLPGGGNGQNLWYRMPSFAFFQLCDPGMAGCSGRNGAYIQGNDAAVCDTGNGATSCLVGTFTDVMGDGTVGPGNGSGTGSKAVGVQLIK
ncbi:MAG: Tad domain-containing protein [Chloroflexi bacterium]|nr:Tad domain-containing protein [Chloroflexota bacterium]